MSQNSKRRRKRSSRKDFDPARDTLLVTIEEAGKRLSLCRSSIYKLVHQGDLKRVYPLERTPRITVESILSFQAQIKLGARLELLPYETEADKCRKRIEARKIKQALEHAS